jgi:hypothetical protein
MTRDCHVRFCESLGLQRPGPLTKNKKAKKATKANRASRDRGAKS